jgi:hypothetical protein
MLLDELNASPSVLPRPRPPKPTPKRPMRATRRVPSEGSPHNPSATQPAPALVPEPPKPSNKPNPNPNPEHEIQLAVEKIQRDLARVLTRIRPTVKVIVVKGQPTRDQLKEYIDLASPSTAGETAAVFGVDLTTYFQILHA